MPEAPIEAVDTVNVDDTVPANINVDDAVDVDLDVDSDADRKVVEDERAELR